MSETLTGLSDTKRIQGKDLRLQYDSGEIKKLADSAGHKLDIIIGQKRAVKALQFGVGIKADGFNVFVSGEPGTGKRALIDNFLKEIAKKQSPPRDWCYVSNFPDPYHPKILDFPSGMAVDFRADMKKLIDNCRKSLLRTFESEEFAGKRKEVIDEFEHKQGQMFQHMTQRSQEEGLMIRQTPMGIITMPVSNGEPLSEEEFSQLEEEEREEIRKKQKKIQDELTSVIMEAKKLEKKANEELEHLEKGAAYIAIQGIVEDLQKKYQDLAKVHAYLEDVKNDILENLPEFLQMQKGKPEPGRGGRGPFPGFPPPDGFTQQNKYEVNVVMDNSQMEGAPVIIELNPTYSNLFGKVEKESYMGALIADFTLIRRGALHRANGGYLILPVLEVLRNPLSWDALKRALRNRQIEIEEPGEQLGFLTTKTLKPQAVPLDLKIILIGPPILYTLLYNLDTDYQELFKIKADFDTVMEVSDENIRDYVSFTHHLCQKEKLAPLDNSAIVKIIEHSSRIAENREKLTTRFGEISDIIREASYYAMNENGERITDSQINKAIEERIYRSNLIQEKINELIKKNIIFIDVTGEKVGQVNGLSVLDLGDIMFGKPNRITANVSIGKDGVVAIERESKLSGPIHNKGVMILSSYFAEHFAIEKPVSMTANLVFEQSYSEIEGDSAASTELYALLSSISGVPLRQNVAVTGSVNQKGQIQPIGGVNEKIEGFYEICKFWGLTGNQGVLIPSANKKHLMLKEEVVEAVDNGKFNVWAIDTIEEGIEILTGVKAGQRKEDGKFEEDTVFDRVDKNFSQYADRVKSFISGNHHPVAVEEAYPGQHFKEGE